MHLHSDTHLQLQMEAQAFALESLRPFVVKQDASGSFPRHWFQQCGKLGLIGADFPVEYGGRELKALGAVLVLEEISKESGSLGAVLAAHMQSSRFLLHNGSEEQKQKYLVPALKGEILLSFALTEESAGSDIAGVETTAVREGDAWILNGSKHWITNGGEAQAYIVSARTNFERSRRGISLFLIEDTMPGLSTEQLEQKMGMNNTPLSGLAIKNCRLPLDCLVGEENKGFDLSNASLGDSRLYLSAVAVGMAQGALDRALNYVKNRQQSDRQIVTYQGVTFPLAEMYAELEAARALLYHMAKIRDELPSTRVGMAALKLFSTNMCCFVCDRALQLFGGNGYLKDFEVERFVRDSRMLKLAGGTSEICKVIVSNSLIYKGK